MADGTGDRRQEWMDAVEASQKGIAKGGAAVQGLTASDISGTTPIAVLSAAASGKSHYITRALITNKTTGETPVIVLQDDSGTPVELAYVAVGAIDTKDITWPLPGLKVGGGKGLKAKATTAIGDTRVAVFGYTADA